MTATRPAPPIPGRPRVRAVARTGAAALMVPTRFLLQRLGVESRLYRVLSRPGARFFQGDGFAGYEPADNDVVVATYIKSGTYWMMQITAQVASRGTGEYAHIHDVVPWPEAPGAMSVSLSDAPTLAPTGLRVIKTHLPVGDVPFGPAARYVTVIRDPKDVFVSSWHFFRGFLAGPLMASIPAWLDLFCSNDFLFGSWAVHTAGWWALRDEPNVLMLAYADLKDDLPGGVDRVADLLDVGLEPGERDAVVDRASFQAMRAMDDRFRPPPLSPFALPGSRLLRRGDYGVADELLDDAGRQRIDRWCRDELARLGSDFPYSDWFGPA